MSDYNAERVGAIQYIDQWDTDPEPKHYVRQVGAAFIPVTPEFHEYLIATVGDAKAKDILNASALFAYARRLEPWDTEVNFPENLRDNRNKYIWRQLHRALADKILDNLNPEWNTDEQPADADAA